MLCALLAGVVATVSIEHGLALSLAPCFVLVTLLVAGLFPGEETIERLRATQRSTQAVERPANVRLPRRTAFMPRVGRALAFALAVRPPPVPVS